MRITRGLRIGEDQSGGLIFHPDPSCPAIGFSIAEDGSLLVAAAPSNYEFALRHAGRKRALRVPPGSGAKIEFPDSILRLTSTLLDERQSEDDFLTATLQPRAAQARPLSAPPHAQAPEDSNDLDVTQSEIVDEAALEMPVHVTEAPDSVIILPEDLERDELERDEEATGIAAHAEPAAVNSTPKSIRLRATPNNAAPTPLPEKPSTAEADEAHQKILFRLAAPTRALLLVAACMVLVAAPLNYPTGPADDYGIATSAATALDPDEQPGGQTAETAALLASIKVLFEDERPLSLETKEYVASTLQALASRDSGNAEAVQALRAFNARLSREADGGDEARIVTAPSEQQRFISQNRSLTTPRVLLPNPALPPASDTLTAEETRMLSDVREFIARGDILDPPRQNAISTLTALLKSNPTNQAAMELMFDCTMLLLEEARRAARAGELFEARNIIEEILAFHPEQPEAHALWRELVGSPYQRVSNVATRGATSG